MQGGPATAEGQAPAAGAPPASGPPPAAPAATGDSFQAGVEAVFRNNPIMGPKVQHIEWTGPETAKLFLHDFPMDQMGLDDMRAMFLERMRGRIKEQKEAHTVAQTARVEVIDAASGRVMETISE